jgi:hypothetical protein
MTCVFELPHIFIVFQPGTSGNFVAGLLNNLINKNPLDVHISPNGSSHTVIERKIAGTDYMSFGTIYEDQLNFLSPDQRLNYYLENIKKLNSEITRPQVIWTHDFSNIPLYRNFFPNSKILVITQNSNLEKLVAVLMNVAKNLVDPNFVAPFPPRQWEDINKHLDFLLEAGLQNLVGKQKSKDIIKNKFNKDNRNLIKFLRTRQLLAYFGLLHLVDKNVVLTKDLANNVLFWNLSDNTEPIKIGLPYSVLIDNECVQLPYSYLIEDQVNLLIDAVTSLVGHLTDAEQTSITEQFNQYRHMQDQTMLTDPYRYYSDLAKTIVI